MATDEGEDVECSHCERSVPLDAASVLNKKGSKGLWRYLCPDCLEDIRVPAGYELERDVSFLRGGGSAAEVLGAEHAEEGPEGEGDGGEATPSTQPSSVLADFRGQFVTGEMANGELSPGRILMDRHRLVLATAGYRTSIPLSEINDVVPPADPDADDDDTGILAVSHDRDDDTETAFIGASLSTLARFTTVLFRALLGGTAVRFDGRDPDGGRSVHDGILHVRSSAVDLEATDRTRSIPRPAGEVSVVEAGWPGADGAALAIDLDEGERVPSAEAESMRTTVVLPTARGRQLLGRLLATDLEGGGSHATGRE